MLIVEVSADDICYPRDVGRRAGEHRRLLIHNASNRAKASYAMNFPWIANFILANQGSP